MGAVGFPKLCTEPKLGSLLCVELLWGVPWLFGAREKILDCSLPLFFLGMFFPKDSSWLDSSVLENTTCSIARIDVFPFGI